MVHNRRQQLISVRVNGTASLAHILATRRHMEQMINDTGADKGVAGTIEIDAPGIARAISKHFELPGARMITGHGGVHFYPCVIGIVRILDDRMSKHTMGHVKPPIRSPGKTIEQFVAIMKAKTA